ncbi:hypothetical protein GL325_07970 [Aeromicrobium sp. 636]|uniref:Ltp family lipoprotein n=2 Tax=Nocardioidaceae TaxID=85015 RepID=A0A8I0JZQ8_9ACTN|nr:Ltp family lipoprotein [Aeromicrobium senzhongii]MCQ3998358.1 hypothetical protein [Aeromicrobium sp. 636]MTB88787.1 hypothetical protein [Aeromicrobium senzhongii]QNL96006.1 Ltp family lipoprotein [Aeromicrobium senzhongii]
MGGSGSDSSGDKEDTTASAQKNTESEKSTEESGTTKTKKKAKTEKAAPKLTKQQQNAVRSAKNYLEFAGFSREGLIRQLSSDAGDGYSDADATAAVDSLDVNWNAEAVESAKNYLDMTGFSCQGLIQQLSSSAGDRYTQKQAEYGAKKAGAC